MEKVLTWLHFFSVLSQSLVMRWQQRPWVKVMDFYLVREVLIPLGYSLFAFILLYVVYDLSLNFNEIFDHGVPLSTLLKYYVVSIPYIFTNCAPIAMLMATLYCLGNLSLHNEITALQANGVALTRVSLPFVIVGLFVSLVVFYVNENWVPFTTHLSESLRQEEIKQKAPEEQEVWKEFAYKSPSTQRYWVGAFDPKKKIFKDVVIREFRKDGSLEVKYSAEETRWIEGSWWLLKGSRALFDLESKQLSSEDFAKKELRIPEKKYETPEDFIRSRKDTMLMGFCELKEHIKIHDKKDAVYKSEKVDLHYKIAFPFISLVVIFLGVPLGLHHSSRRGAGALAGFGMSLVLCLTYYAFTLFSLAIGKEGWLPAWLAAWLPNLLFMSVGTGIGIRIFQR